MQWYITGSKYKMVDIWTNMIQLWSTCSIGFEYSCGMAQCKSNDWQPMTKISLGRTVGQVVTAFDSRGFKLLYIDRLWCLQPGNTQTKLLYIDHSCRLAVCILVVCSIKEYSRCWCVQVCQNSLLYRNYILLVVVLSWCKNNLQMLSIATAYQYWTAFSMNIFPLT